MPRPPSSRLAYIDWLRGLACVLMFQTHCYDAWLGDAARSSQLFLWSQLGGTFPAPLFLFLAGTSLAIASDKALRNSPRAGQIAQPAIRRGLQILGLAMLFRLQEFLISLGWAPWSDLFRVDILNLIGVSIVLLGVAMGTVVSIAHREKLRPALAASALAITGAIALVTPLVWTVWRPRFLPWPLESYVDGVHNLGAPQAWLFPVFPWTAFAFAGLAFGMSLTSDFFKNQGARAFLGVGLAGIALVYAGRLFDRSAFRLYPVYDFWHTSPNFFLMRLGWLLVFVASAYAWCRWGPGQWGFSPLVQLGSTSLLVYWVHIEFVYGRFSILARRSQTVASASTGLLVIFLAMLALSWGRTSWKRRAAREKFSPSGQQPRQPQAQTRRSLVQGVAGGEPPLWQRLLGRLRADLLAAGDGLPWDCRRSTARTEAS
jgi:uncharacterized membrane protein